MNDRRAHIQRGFTVPEMLVAMLLIATLALVALGTLQFFVRTVDARTYGLGGAASVERELATMRDDANTAFAVFVPAKDVFGAPNAPPASSHEVDYYAKTDTGAETWWAYYFDAKQKTLQRYDYNPATGARGVFDRTNGTIDARGRYPQITGVTAFAAQPVQADALADAKSNPFAPIVQTLVGPNATPQADPVGFVPSNDQPRADLYGGNTTVQVVIETQRGRHTLHVLSGAMPSGFTIHEAMAIRAFVYRVNTVHRSWIGFAQKTKAQIFEQLQYSFHPKTDPPGTWKVWCDFQVYGYGAGGLTLNDPNAVYHPKNFDETAASIYYRVTHDSVRSLNPNPGGCNKHVPKIDDTPAPAYTGPSPDTYDTPPPCFAQGACYPENAPPNWTPQSPWPSSPPPPSWCAGHQQSPLCGGAGGTPVPIVGPAPTPVYYTPGPALSPPPVGSPPAVRPIKQPPGLVVR